VLSIRFLEKKPMAAQELPKSAATLPNSRRKPKRCAGNTPDGPSTSETTPTNSLFVLQEPYGKSLQSES